MKQFILEEKQHLGISLEEAWEFFSNPINLKSITPPGMGFSIINGQSSPIFNGQIIRYKVRPLLNLPMLWESEISGVIPNRQFIDTQIRGPYSFWRHIHTFRDIPGGVEIKDKVEYSLGYGKLGALLHKWVVAKKLRQIFLYRNLKLQELFGDLELNFSPVA